MLREVLTDGREALLVPAEDPRAWEMALRRLTEPELRQELAADPELDRVRDVTLTVPRSGIIIVNASLYTYHPADGQYTRCSITTGTALDSGAFAITFNNCTGTSVPNGGTCRITVAFIPPATGPFQGSISISEVDGSGVLLVAGGDTITVTLSNEANGYVVADGVRIERVLASEIAVRHEGEELADGADVVNFGVLLQDSGEPTREYPANPNGSPLATAALAVSGTR